MDVYWIQFKCSPMFFDFFFFTFFEFRFLELGVVLPVLFAVVYHPPEPAGCFGTELSECLTSMVVNYDWNVLCSDFNIHVGEFSNVFLQADLNPSA